MGTDSHLPLHPSWDRRLLGEPFEPYYELVAWQVFWSLIGPFVDFHPVYREWDAERRAAVMADLWERMRVVGLGEMVTLTEVQKEARWHAWQAVTLGGGLRVWAEPWADGPYENMLPVDAHHGILSSEPELLSSLVGSPKLLNEFLRRTMAAAMYAYAAELQLAVLSQAQIDKRGGVLRRWRAFRAKRGALPGVRLAVINVWGQWPHDHWDTSSGIGGWRPDDSALAEVMDSNSDNKEVGVPPRAVADVRAAAEILGWFTMAALVEST